MKTNLNRHSFGTAVCLLVLWMTSGCANKTGVAENEQADGYSEVAQESGEAEETAEADTEAATEQAEPAEGELFATAEDPGQAPSETTTESLFQEGAATDPALELSEADKAAAIQTAPEATADGAFPTNTADPLAANTLTDPAAEAQAFSPDASFEKATGSTRAAYSGSVLPSISGEAISRNGHMLNRFYFLRAGDTPATVAQLIYSDGSQAKQLKKWNKGGWSAGKVIYYSSPSQPDDGRMASFYEERGLVGESYTVHAGDSMSTIAKKKLGSLASWKELAVVNRLSSPDSLRRGQTLTIYTDLSSGAPQMAAAQTAPPPAVDFAPTTPAPDPIAAQPPTAMNTPPVQPEVIPPPVATDDLLKPKKKPRKEGLNLVRLLTQNAFSLAMGLGIGLLLVSLLLVNKRKRSNGGGGIEDFNEDAFAPPGKKKRR